MKCINELIEISSPWLKLSPKRVPLLARRDLHSETFSESHDSPLARQSAGKPAVLCMLDRCSHCHWYSNMGCRVPDTFSRWPGRTHAWSLAPRRVCAKLDAHCWLGSKLASGVRLNYSLDTTRLDFTRQASSGTQEPVVVAWNSPVTLGGVIGSLRSGFGEHSCTTLHSRSRTYPSSWFPHHRGPGTTARRCGRCGVARSSA